MTNQNTKCDFLGDNQVIRRDKDSRAERATVAAIIVLYHPNPSLLMRLIDSIIAEVDRLFVVDNTPGANSNPPALFLHCAISVSYHAPGINKGVATAQNIGIRRAIEENYTHVILLDQDSALPKDAIASLLAAEHLLLQAGYKIAAVGPLFVDEKSGERSCAVRHALLRVQRILIGPSETAPVETDYLISSGSLIRTSMLSKVGLMRDELFIDWVDAEWAYRARSFGYRTYIAPNVLMTHSIGDATARVLGRRIYLHNAARDYYIVRNAAYLLREPRMGWRWRLVTLVNLPKHIVIHSWFSQKPFSRLSQMLHAMWEGLFGKMRGFSAI
ncbi:MAG: glycosyltransferase family 2 protein [Terracidiphilus sp.]|jgi:rhamnosyltransferase